MKKSIAIIIDTNTKLQLFLEENLKLVLGDYVNFNHYFIDEISEDSKIDDDLVLVMAKDRLYKINRSIVQKSKVIVIRRTFQEDKIYELFSIPKGADVLVVNDTDETTLETMSLFYKIGIKDLKLVPYLNGKNYEDIDIAITPGVECRVPSHIHKVINLGNRCIDMSTFIEIINELDIDLKDIRKNLIKYSEKIITLEDGVKDKYRELFLKIEELDIVLNLSKDGIIFTSEDNIIKTINKNALEILNIKNEMKSTNIGDFFKDELKVLLEEDELVDEVVFFNKKYININKKSIYNMGDKIGTYYSFQEITYIKKLEQNLTKKLRQSGQIAKYNFNNIETKNSKMTKCIEMAKKISKSDLSVLIIGESGTGKELMAQSIHNNSNRSNQPFIAVNCAAVPENLLESELFGYEKGTFTGGLREGKKGLFEMANNGTIFLDEIGDMPPLLQTKLLRVLQEKQIMPVGSHNIIDIDVRVISATNKNLLKRIKENKFREDLYYRLNVLPVDIPPLRERKEDILDLLKSFLDKNINITAEVKKVLSEYNWPGNIRELQNVSSFLDLMCNDIVLKSDLPSYINICGEDEDCCDLEYDTNEIKEILHILMQSENLECGVGRALILENLKHKNIDITEGRVRKILNYLKENEYITCKTGRSGSKITDKGNKIYIKLNNKI